MGRSGSTSERELLYDTTHLAPVVDRQNANDKTYRPLAPNFDDNIAFQAAKELVLEGTTQPNGYTEPILHRRRREFKAAQK
ncbi:hypothetical protein ASD42_32660 [Nocardia sp. Root136]|nr:hypothetical protein ASD42_32660 [Nocardia sp. Root136]